MLSFPAYQFQLRRQGQKNYIFDRIRKKYVVLTPEEWVRQHVVFWLLDDYGVPEGWIALERGIIINGLRRRTDLMVMNREAVPMILVECKAPQIPVNQAVVEQALRYNMETGVRYLWLTNGLEHRLWKMSDTGPQPLDALPKPDEW
ncbi:MAG: type I restriction enzyme HsdR N-terminal domain-containing protein [Bacteroidetes bacterium]|nr:type I restriction enzyme HsdR N-terminal domain-containing protein [Bacteroidota bacterium]